MLDISAQQLRSWQRRALLPGTGEFHFTDLIAANTLKQLRDKRVPASRIAKVVASLKRKLSGVERPLSEVRIVFDGRTIFVRMPGEKMEAITGQLLLDFETAELNNLKTMGAKSRAEPAAMKAARLAQAEHWFQKGLALEESGAPIEEAIGAYRKAAELNPNAAGALVNLGTIYYHLRRFKEAEANYLAAAAADPNYALAQFNLGNLYDELGETAKAAQHYQDALRLDPAYADAYYNLALLHEKTGDFLKAAHHWRLYLKLDPSSSWARVARRQLDKLRQATIVK